MATMAKIFAQMPCDSTYSACAAMELRPRPFAEQLRKDCDFACAKLAASEVGAAVSYTHLTLPTKA